ncbi:hypothetical protein TIFTF001_044520 [Ficus carica]|uniref:C2 NT-type domain-containing protein n=1 Tax=Ficus carica TaxID=3494 RepID=A0AA87ZAV8_FICCA|nr:hypothetical protein TIFTF001_044520 [Ficus carica]
MMKCRQQTAAIDETPPSLSRTTVVAVDEARNHRRVSSRLLVAGGRSRVLGAHHVKPSLPDRHNHSSSPPRSPSQGTHASIETIHRHQSCRLLDQTCRRDVLSGLERTVSKVESADSVSRLELQGFDCESENAVAIEVKWRKGGSNGKPGLRLVPFYGRRSTRSQRNFTARRGFRGGGTVAWDDEFENLCDFPAFGSDWNLVFSLLFGGREESKKKMATVGKVSMNLSGEGEMERKLPMAWKVGGGAGEATLSVSLSS